MAIEDLIGAAIRQKLDAAAEMQKQQLNSPEALATTNLTNVRAGLLPGESAAGVAKTTAETANTNVQTQLAPKLAQGVIGLQNATGRLALSQAAGEDITSKGYTYGMPSSTDRTASPATNWGMVLAPDGTYKFRQ